MPVNSVLDVNISFVVSNGLCTGCGTCAGTCPKSAIRMQIKKGLYLPQVDQGLCRQNKGCDICVQVCPGHSVNMDDISADIFPRTVKNFYLGRVASCFVGHSVNYNIRYHSASGGIASQLLIFMLEEQIINGAVVTKIKQGESLEPESFIATTREEIIQSRSSKYCPVPLNVLIRELLDKEGKYAVVGLPCHIHGFRKAEKMFPNLKNKVSLYLGLFCSSTKTFHATNYIFNQFKLLQNNIGYFSYRDEGWLGNLVVKNKTGETKRIPYRTYYPQLRSFFIPFRCTLCVDHCAELADISLGDIYVSPYYGDEIGTSVIIARSLRGLDALRKAQVSKGISMQPINIKEVIKSQKRMMERKKCQFVMKKNLLRLFRKKTPQYDLNNFYPKGADNLKYFLSALVLYFEIAIGKQKILWPLISKLNILAKAIKK